MSNLETGFHWRDGWFFKRLPGGLVRVTHLSVGHELVSFEIPPNEWASIVCSVTRDGETGERWDAARKFHGIEP